MTRAVRRTALQPLWPGGCRLVQVFVLPCHKATLESLQQFATGMLRDGAFFGKTRKTVANTVCGNVHAGMMLVYTFVTQAINVFVNRRSSVQIRQLAPFLSHLFAMVLRVLPKNAPSRRFLVAICCKLSGVAFGQGRTNTCTSRHPPGQSRCNAVLRTAPGI